LLQSKFTPETAIVFNGKEELMRSHSASIDHSNYDEWLVLAGDDELTVDQRLELEQFISRNPYIQKELGYYKQAKLQPDEKIVFPDKFSLYRREEKVRTIRWWRIAAAAVLLLMAGLTYVLVNRNANGKQAPGLVVQPIKNENSSTGELAVDKQEKDKQPNTPVIEDTSVRVIKPVRQPGNGIAVKTTIYSKGSQKNIQQLPIKDDRQVIGSNNNPFTDDLSARVLKDKKNSVIALHTVDKPSNEMSNNVNAVTNPVDLTYNNNRSLTGDNPDASFASLEETGKNKKNRGLFRKAVRFFEKNTNINAANDDRLLVGGLAIKLK
jgi:hypothetical protein